MLRIVVDSSAEFTLAELEEKNIELIPLNIHIGDDCYRDIVDITPDKLYEVLEAREYLPKTSQPSPQSFLEIFEDAKAKGDTVLVLCLSSSISGTYQTANLAKDMAEYNNIHIFDTLSATHGIRILADKANEMRNAGADVSEIIETLDELKSRIMVFVAVDSLEFLCKGGRVSKAAAAIGELANVKPIITVTKEGTVSVIAKALGRNKAIATVVKHLSEANIDREYPIYNLYGYDKTNSSKLNEKLEAAGFTCDRLLQVGATIGVHVGPGAYGVIYITKA